MEGKSWIAVAVLDDISNMEKNLQMHQITDRNALFDKEDKVKEFDTFKIERVEMAWSKFREKVKN